MKYFHSSYTTKAFRGNYEMPKRRNFAIKMCTHRFNAVWEFVFSICLYVSTQKLKNVDILFL